MFSRWQEQNKKAHKQEAGMRGRVTDSRILTSRPIQCSFDFSDDSPAREDTCCVQPGDNWQQKGEKHSAEEEEEDITTEVFHSNCIAKK